MTQQNHEVDIAKYAKVELKKQDISLLWEEPRDIFKVVVRCSKPSALSGARLQYWQDHWPHQRLPKGAVVGAGGSGWMAQDDWFNGKWKDADFNVAVEGNEAVYTLPPYTGVSSVTKSILRKTNLIAFTSRYRSSHSQRRKNTNWRKTAITKLNSPK